MECAKWNKSELEWFHFHEKSTTISNVQPQQNDSYVKNHAIMGHFRFFFLLYYSNGYKRIWNHDFVWKYCLISLKFEWSSFCAQWLFSLAHITMTRCLRALLQTEKKVTNIIIIGITHITYMYPCLFYAICISMSFNRNFLFQSATFFRLHFQWNCSLSEFYCVSHSHVLGCWVAWWVVPDRAHLSLNKMKMATMLNNHERNDNDIPFAIRCACGCEPIQRCTVIIMITIIGIIEIIISSISSSDRRKLRKRLHILKMNGRSHAYKIMRPRPGAHEKKKQQPLTIWWISLSTISSLDVRGNKKEMRDKRYEMGIMIPYAFKV